MRNIKFRAWDKVLKQIGPVVGLEWHDTQLNSIYIQHPDPVHGTYKVLRTDLSGPLMQFTGLQDRTGRDIYQGDIAFDLHSEEHGQIVFDEGCFYFIHEGLIEQLSEVADSIEVIGNIYENPDLLTSS